MVPNSYVQLHILPSTSSGGMWIIFWSVFELALQLPTLTCKLGVFISTKKCRKEVTAVSEEKDTCDSWPPKNAERWNSMDFFVEIFWWCYLSCLLVNHHHVHVRQNMLFPSHPPKREHRSLRRQRFATPKPRGRSFYLRSDTAHHFGASDLFGDGEYVTLLVERWWKWTFVVFKERGQCRKSM